MKKEKLSDELKNKIVSEQEVYISDLLKLSKWEIINKAYEQSARELISNVLLYNSFTENVEKELSKLQNPIGCLYDEWIHTEDDVEFSVKNMIENWCEKEVLI